MKSSPEIGQSEARDSRSKLAKTNVRYWDGKLRKRTYVWNGKDVEVPEWQVRIGHAGKQQWFNLQTTNRTAAADKARKVYLSLLAKGWDQTLAEFKPKVEQIGNAATV